MVSTLPATAGLPASLGPTSEAAEVFRLRDFWASPARGRRGAAEWRQTMGSLELRLELRGEHWQGVTEDEFQVRLCDRGLRVKNKRRLELADVIEHSLCGDFQDEVSTSCSWWCLQRSPDVKTGRSENALLVHVVKTKDGSWQQPFNVGRLAVASDLSADWVSLRPGRQQVEDTTSLPGISAQSFVEDLLISQTEDLVTFRLILHEALLNDARRRLPMSQLWGLDLRPDAIHLFLRSTEGLSLLAGRLGGRIIPDETDWCMTKVTREGSANKRETVPALSVQLRKAEGSRFEWSEVISGHSIKEAKVANAMPDGAIRGLDEDQAAAAALDAGAPALEREGWTPADFARGKKGEGDACFRQQEWSKAIELYTKALEHTPEDEKMLSNRSAAYMEAKQFQSALDDAMRCEEVAPEWPKSYFRQGVALRALRRYDMAVSAFSEGSLRDPSNPNWQVEIDDAEEKKRARQANRQRASVPLR